jgi:hypothetical protein
LERDCEDHQRVEADFGPEFPGGCRCLDFQGLSTESGVAAKEFEINTYVGTCITLLWPPLDVTGGTDKVALKVSGKVDTVLAKRPRALGTAVQVSPLSTGAAPLWGYSQFQYLNNFDKLTEPNPIRCPLLSTIHGSSFSVSIKSNPTPPNEAGAFCDAFILWESCEARG